jgi:GntR family transcriptional regulator, transcriptional repressor for pyruvate dehydrogenase complex
MTTTQQDAAQARSNQMNLADAPIVGVVVQHVRTLIERGELRPGDRVPSERELALRLRVSRGSLRAGLRSLATIGVLHTRHGEGSFITASPRMFESGPLSVFAALHRLTPDQMFEARCALEIGVAGLAAERVTDEHTATMADEVIGMFASIDDPHAFLVHDIGFHFAVASASSNRVLASLIETLSVISGGHRCRSIQSERDLKQSAQIHLNIYQAIRAHDWQRACEAMSAHFALLLEAGTAAADIG